MNYKFSYKVPNLKPNSNTLSDNDTIIFSSDMPSGEPFAFDAIKRIGFDVMSENPDNIINIGKAEGYEPLRIFLRGLLFQKNIIGEHDGVVLLNCFCEALDLICRTLTDDGDTVICEEPVANDILNVFRLNGLKVIGVPLNNDGLDLDRLHSALIKYPSTKFIFTTPNFQNPTGITLSEEKREEIYSIAHKYDTAIIENDLYCDLRFQGADMPSIKSFDKEGRVIYLSGFESILYPFSKTAYICADTLLLSKLSLTKGVYLSQANTFEQVVIKRFFDEFDYFDYTFKLSGYYRSKCETMLSHLQFELPTSISFTEPEGGFFIMGTLPIGTDVNRFCKLMLDRKISLSPVTEFLINDKNISNSFRLNFSVPSEEQIIKGIKILGEASKLLAL